MVYIDEISIHCVKLTGKCNRYRIKWIIARHILWITDEYN